MHGSTDGPDGKTFLPDHENADFGGKTGRREGRTFPRDGLIRPSDGRTRGRDGKTFHLDGKTFPRDAVITRLGGKTFSRDGKTGRGDDEIAAHDGNTFQVVLGNSIARGETGESVLGTFSPHNAMTDRIAFAGRRAGGTRRSEDAARWRGGGGVIKSG